MPRHVIFLINLLIVIAVVPSSHATLQTSIDLQISVPDSFPYYGDFSLVDVDRDGQVDLLQQRGDTVCSYSLSSHETLDWLILPTLSEYYKRYAVGWLDGDDRIDVAKAVIVSPDVASRQFLLVFYARTNGVMTADTVVVLNLESGEEYHWQDYFIRDLDGDGFSEVYGAFYYTHSFQYWPDEPPVVTYYWTRFRYDCASGEYSEVDRLPLQWKDSYIDENTGETIYWSRVHGTHSYPGSHGIEPYTYSWEDLKTGLFDSVFNTLRIWSESEPGVEDCPYFAQTYDRDVFLWQYVVADILPEHPGHEFVGGFVYSAWGLDFLCGESDTSFARAYVYSLEDPFNPNLLRTIDPYTGVLTSGNPVFALPGHDYTLYTYSAGEHRFYSAGTESYQIQDSSNVLPFNANYYGVVELDSKSGPHVVLRDGRHFYFVRVGTPTDVDNSGGSLDLPESFTLSQPYPNPFNPTVSFSITLPVKTNLTVEIYNTLGQRVERLFDGDLPAGEKLFEWDGTDYASGVYLIKVSTESETRSVKAILVK
ncbi:T9SS type A sorting domain-containing protein [bacterium]|nr:T9SS type A sorting domain-containing protein [bacterium]